MKKKRFSTGKELYKIAAAFNNDELPQAIDARTTDKIAWNMISALDFMTRLRLGQFGNMFTCFEQLGIKFKKDTLNYIREDLHKLIDLLCDNPDISYKNRKLHDFIFSELDHKTNGRSLAQPIDIEEPLYKALELAEYLLCKSKYGKCHKAKDCWVTRRGFGMCPYTDEKNKITVNTYISECCKAKVQTHMSPDFFGDEGEIVEKMIVGTCSYICTKCNKACNIISKKEK